MNYSIRIDYLFTGIEDLRRSRNTKGASVAAGQKFHTTTVPAVCRDPEESPLRRCPVIFIIVGAIRAKKSGETLA